MPMRGNQRVRRLAVAGGGLVIAVAIICGVAGCSFPGPNTGRQDWPAQFRSNGERIYFTATSSSGAPIRSAGGSMHMQMRGAGCVNCHGADRQGGRLTPRFWKLAPPLTPAALFEEHDDDPGDDGHGDHEGYDDATLGRAITEGLDPGGKPFDSGMPRWSMSDQDLADLIEFLESPVSN